MPGTLYVQPTDLLQQINPVAFVNISDSDQMAACASVSDEADGYLASRGPLPVLAFPVTLTKMCAWMAIDDLLIARGRDPIIAHSGDDNEIKTRRDLAVKWLRDVSKQNISPPGLVFALPPGPQYQIPQVSACPQRGW